MKYTVTYCRNYGESCTVDFLLYEMAERCYYELQADPRVSSVRLESITLIMELNR